MKDFILTAKHALKKFSMAGRLVMCCPTTHHRSAKRMLRNLLKTESAFPFQCAGKIVNDPGKIP